MLQQIGSMVLFLAAFGFTASAQAVLHDRGNGMIYDDALNVTWLQNANYAKTSGYSSDGRMDWSSANEWASNLEYSGYDDWRLPAFINGLANYEDSSCSGICGSELGFMFSENLGISNGTIFHVVNQDNLNLFFNWQSWGYWFGVEQSSNPLNAWAIFTNTPNGFQSVYRKENEFYAWAVRDGDVAPIPIPATVWLFVSGLGLLGLTRKLKV